MLAHARSLFFLSLYLLFPKTISVTKWNPPKATLDVYARVYTDRSSNPKRETQRRKEKRKRGAQKELIAVARDSTRECATSLLLLLLRESLDKRAFFFD